MVVHQHHSPVSVPSPSPVSTPMPLNSDYLASSNPYFQPSITPVSADSGSSNPYFQPSYTPVSADSGFDPPALIPLDQPSGPAVADDFRTSSQLYPRTVSIPATATSAGAASFGQIPFSEPIDVICAMGFIDQLQFSSTILCPASNKSVKIPCVVDTGAGLGYLLLPFHEDFDIPTQPCKASVQLADGSRVNIAKNISVLLTVKDRTHRVDLSVIAADIESANILFGRNLIEMFDLKIEGSRLVRMGRHILFDARSDRVCVVEEKHLVEVTEPLESEAVELPLSEELQIDNLSIAESLLGAPQGMQFCPSVLISLRRLQEGEPRDTKFQRFVFEIECTAPRPDEGAVSPRLYARSAMDRLSSSERRVFQEKVDAYVKAGWWKPTTRDAARRLSAPANVFAIKQGEKLRLVADFREVNLHFASSTSMANTSDCLWGLLLSAGPTTVVADCKSAFLRVRLKAPLWLHTAVGDFVTTRMSFGLSFGPEGLRLSAGRLWQKFCQSLDSGAGALFVDDWFLTGETDVTLRRAAKLVHLFNLCGFDHSPEKFQVVTRPGTLRYLNCDIILDDKSTLFNCNRSQRMSAVQEYLADPRPWTKARVFAVAGLLSYDIGQVHPESRLVADLLRSIIGSYCSGLGWHQQIDKLPPEAEEAMSRLWKACDKLSREKCAHGKIPLGLNLDFRLQADASLTGGGYVLSILSSGQQSSVPSWLAVREACWAWNAAEEKYSINRLELTASAQAVRRSVLFLEHLRSTSFGSRTISLSIECDNKPTVSWLTKGGDSINEASVEKRVIERKIAGVLEELHTLHRLKISCSISHVKGEANGADRLSRLSIEVLPVGIPRRRKKTAPTARESVMLVSSSPTTSTALQERIASTTRDLMGSLDLFESFKTSASVLLARASFNAEFFDGLERISFQGALGDQKLLIKIPASFPHLQSQLISYFHRLNAHRGVQHTLADVLRAGYFLERGRGVVSKTLRNCLICAKKLANNASAPVMPTATFKRDPMNPVFTRCCIDHLFTKPLSLSVQCLDTGFVTLMIVSDKTTKATVHALQRVANRYSVTFKLIHSDNYSSFATPILISSLKKLGHLSVQFTAAPPAASDLNPVERVHREVWSTLRCRKFCSRISEEMRDSPEETLEAVCAIINSRPIAFDPPSTVITPATMAFGSIGGLSDPPTDRFVQTRQLFYDQYFDQLRRRFSSKFQRKNLVRPNQLVFARVGSPSKDEFQVKPGRIVSIDGAVISVLVAGKIFKLSSTQVVPLGKYWQAEEMSEAEESPGEGTLQLGNVDS